MGRCGVDRRTEKTLTKCYDKVSSKLYQYRETLKLGKIFGEGVWFDFESADPRKNHDTWIWTIE